MKPAPFEYHKPATLDEAVLLLGRHENAKILAGGQSLMALMNFRFVMPDDLVDIGGIAGLSGISIDGEMLRIGAMTRQRDLEFSPDIAKRCPLIQAAILHVGHRQTRNRGTIGGSLAHADPSAELPTICSVLDARIEILGPEGKRTVPIAEFNLGYMTTAIMPNEILTSVEIDLWPAGHGYSFKEFARRHGDFAIVGVAVQLSLREDGKVERVAASLCGVSDRPVRMPKLEESILGQMLTDSLIEDAADYAGEVEALDDFHASAPYRQHLASVLTRRALHEARDRAVPNRQ